MKQKYCVLQWFLVKTSPKLRFRNIVWSILWRPNLFQFRENTTKTTTKYQTKTNKPKKQKQWLRQNGSTIMLVGCCLQILYFLFFSFIGFLVFPLNWDRFAQFWRGFCRNHCKIQCFCIIFCMKYISQEHPFC